MTMLVRIVDGVDDLLGIVLFGEGTCRAGYDTLTAGDAGNIAERLLESTADFGIKAAVVRADDGDVLAAGRLPRSGGTGCTLHYLVSRCRVL